MDKPSVLGATITYLKYLQERVKILEEQLAPLDQSPPGPGALLAHSSSGSSQTLVDDDHGDHEVEEATSSGIDVPEIDAKISGTSLLIRVHCEKHKGVLVSILSQVEQLNLDVVSISVTPFGTRAHDITIIAEMEEEFSRTAREVVEILRTALRQRCMEN